MMKTNWMKLGMIAILTVLSAACGRYGQVAGRTYVATANGYGAQTAYGYNNGYNTGYGYNNYNNYGYNGYNTGYGMNGYNTGYSTGESISFDNNGRVSYRLPGGSSVVGGSYNTDSGSSVTVTLDAGAQTGMMYQGNVGGTANGIIRFTVNNDGNMITNQNTGQTYYRQ